jgi:hypothetical protein
MAFQIGAVVVLLWIVLLRALLVSARVVPPSCRRCGLQLERRRLGERVCSCPS